MLNKSGLFKRLGYVLSSNLISLIASVLVILIVPKILGVEEYGYWQLYLFYASYAGFLLLGWNDGIYLRYGGVDYSNLNKKLLSSQIWTSAFYQLLIFIILISVTQIFNATIIISLIACSILLTNTSGIPLSILQSTNKLVEHSRCVIFGRIVYILLVIVFFAIGMDKYYYLIIFDLVGKFITLLLSLYYCKDLVFNNLREFRIQTQEILLNINVGIKLMFANIASMLVIGVVRFGIERSWDVSTFGKVSLTLSISNMTLIFINAIGIIMFPILRNVNSEKLSSIYSNMRDFLMVLLLGVLIIYYPVKTLLTEWLPNYAESLMYMALVFPILIYEGKMSLLINTYLKTLRKEKVMLKINIVSLLMSIISTFIFAYVYRNLDLAVLSIVLLLAFRSILAEIILSYYIKINIKKDVILELLMTFVFIFSGWFINSWYTFLIFGVSYILYIVVKLKDIRTSFSNIKLLMGIGRTL